MVKNGVLKKAEVAEVVKWVEKQIRYTENALVEVQVVENLLEEDCDHYAQVRIENGDAVEFNEFTDAGLSLHKATVAATQVLEALQSALRWQIEDGEVTLISEVRYQTYC